ncbi:hypothetical protein MPDQ_005400 [Monascus purpureus]|uniref:Monooxygenase n=1 Tax=Monascus purpureus TaxID=5098 RepID=A0A507R154_MONPU|nr:hypothetical protein MPDQ_005400 [Monascus purpureus]BDD60089.1 hypothetical protein MAP00_005252 [Monascus purpureus]
MRTKLKDEDLANKLIPNFALGCRRLTPDIGYLEALGEPSVTTVYGEITKMTPKGVVTDSSKEYKLDGLVCAAGFDTTFKPRFPLIGRNGANLGEEWKDEPRSYLGLATHGIPQLLYVPWTQVSH